MIVLKSIALKDHPILEPGAALVDCRKLKNPHKSPTLAPLTGQHPQIQKWLQRNEPALPAMIQRVKQLAVERRLVVCGCYGGRHRSVTVVELVAEQLRQEGHIVEVKHLALEKT